MYQNEQLNLLISALEDNIPGNISQKIDTIANIYKAYNDGYEKYTGNYIDMMESAFSTLSISKWVPKAKGGTLLDTKPLDTENISKDLAVYIDKLNKLRNLKFLSEQKKTVVFVGPNGCGKTTLLRDLINATGEEKIGYYPADRLLVINDTYNPERDFSTFSKSYKNTDKGASSLDNSSQASYITQQINQAITLFEKKRAEETDLCVKKQLQLSDCVTEKIINIWNNLIKDRILFSEGSLKIKTLTGDEHPLKYMSSGEKSILYFLLCILLKEPKAYYFIDEPENNLNPSIVSKLWDAIEKHRPESIFIYLTHDNNFVSSRVNSKVFWIKSYDGKEWDHQLLPENDNLPQALMIDLIGNKEPVLFCESKDESKYDDIIFKMMFPEFKVIPSGGCATVISKVKAYAIAGLPQKAYGIIDCDYREECYLEGQKQNNIFHIPFFEIENFLFSEEIITGVISEYSRDSDNAFANLKIALKTDFLSKKEQWITRKVAFALKDTFYNKGINDLSTFDELTNKYTTFLGEINLQDLYTKYANRIQEVIDKDDYNTYLRFYDNKGIFTKFLTQLKLQNKMPYKDAVFAYLYNHKDLLATLRSRYFPDIVI